MFSRVTAALRNPFVLALVASSFTAGCAASPADDTGQTEGDLSEAIADLSRVGTGDFAVDFSLTTSMKGGGALVGQRASCQHGRFWDVRLDPTGHVRVETDDGSRYAVLTSSGVVNDGKAHWIAIRRLAGTLTLRIDGQASPSVPSTSILASLAPIATGTNVCESSDGTKRLTGTLGELSVRALQPTFSDLSGVGTGNFQIELALATTMKGVASLVGQRASCQHGMFWDVRLTASGRVQAETDDGSNYAVVESSVVANDGAPHWVEITRSGGLLSVRVDGVRSARVRSLSNLGALPRLETRTGACTRADGTQALEGTLAFVTIKACAR